MKYWIFWLLFCIAIGIEGVGFALPLSLVFLLILYVYKKPGYIFAAAFFVGMLHDIFLFQPLGRTSLFLLFFLFLVVSYERKFELLTLPFIVFSSFLGSLLFLLLFQGKLLILQSLIATSVAVGLLVGIGYFRRKHSDTTIYLR